MGILTKLFKKKENTIRNEECLKLMELDKNLSSLLSVDKYIAKSEYLDILKQNEELIKYFTVLKKSSMLATFCKNNNISKTTVIDTVRVFNSFEKLVDLHNNQYIETKLKEEKEYLDTILYDVDPVINLDRNQREVILSDEDYSLVIAGAGAGKTTTVAAKIKYLCDKKGVKPSQILVVSFTNKAVQELRDKVNIGLGLDCPITTFHSTGNAIIRKQSDEKLNIVDSNKLYFVILDYFKSSLLKNESLVNNLILFFASYFDAPYEGEDLNFFFNKLSKTNFSTLRSDFDEYKKKIMDSRTKKSLTIQNEFLRSSQEVSIANFLYLNQIEYEYEPVYQYNITYSRKPYTPDFVITQGDKVAYIEHFGITQSGKNNRYSADQLEMYKKAINDKVALHKKHNTNLIYTFSEYNDKRPLIEHLQEELLKLGFELNPRSNKEVMEKLIYHEEDRYIRKLVSLISRFIGNFKTNGYADSEFDRMYHSTHNVRTKLFLNICHDCYLEYQRYLKENHAVDFQDMINESVRILREVEEVGEKLDFKYIIVDEYQDISLQRFDLVTSLSKVTSAKIIAVGDDWQSIYAFSGSDVTLFTKFKEKMGYAKLLKIVNTYRNSQEVIDIAGNFIQKNKEQIQKELVSPKHIEDPVIIYTYDDTHKKQGADNKSGANYAIAKAVEVALEQIMEFNEKEGKPKDSSILLLGRFGFDGDKLEKSGLFEYRGHERKLKSVKYPFLNITFMTAHASKGLGYDNVVIVNGRNETYGFPSKIEDDPVLSFVIKGDRSIDYAEERRLFYVALTRTKNRVFIVAPEKRPSEFLLEIKKDYKNVVLRGEWNDKVSNNDFNKKVCPICGYPLQFKYKHAYGLRLYICTNEPEICGFMTNEYGAGKLSIFKCDKCRDGYMIVKPSKDNNYFMGCTNYKKDGTGCDNVYSQQSYYNMAGIQQEDAQSAKKTKRNTYYTKWYRYVPTDEIIKANLEDVFFNSYNLNDVIYTVLQCLSQVSEFKFYGINMLLDILRGIDSKKILDAHLFEVPEFGSLSYVKREDLLAIIEWLIEKHYILQTKEQYPALHPTYEGKNYASYITQKQLVDLQTLLMYE